MTVDPWLIKETFRQKDRSKKARLKEIAELGVENGLMQARQVVSNLIWERERLGEPTKDLQEALDGIGEL